MSRIELIGVSGPALNTDQVALIRRCAAVVVSRRHRPLVTDLGLPLIDITPLAAMLALLDEALAAGDVAVLGASQLVWWLKKQKPILEPAQVAAVAAAVRTEATWSSEPRALPDTSGFAALRREVDGARRTRMAWGIAVLVAILGITGPLALDFYARTFGG